MAGLTIIRGGIGNVETELFMAGDAPQRQVLPIQGESRVGIMVECHVTAQWTPCIVPMAGEARESIRQLAMWGFLAK